MELVLPIVLTVFGQVGLLSRPAQLPPSSQSAPRSTLLQPARAKPNIAQAASYNSLSPEEQTYVDAAIKYQDRLVPILQEMIRDEDNRLVELRQGVRQMKTSALQLRLKEIRETVESRKELQSRLDAAIEQKSRGRAPDIVLSPSWAVPSIGTAGTCALPTMVRQVISKDKMLVEIVGGREGHNLVYIHGVSTYGVTDDMYIKLPPVAFIGTETYTTTIGGSNTVFKGVVVEPDRLQTVIHEKMREVYRPQMAKSAPAQPSQASK